MERSQENKATLSLQRQMLEKEAFRFYRSLNPYQFSLDIFFSFFAQIEKFNPVLDETWK